MSLNAKTIDQRQHGVLGDSLAVSSSSLGIIQTYITKSDSPWSTPITNELNHAKALALEWRGHFYPEMFLNTMQDVVNCGLAFSNAKTNIDQLFKKSPSDPNVKDELEKEFNTLKTLVDGISKSYSKYESGVASWGASMGVVHSKMEVTIAKVQAQETKIKAEIETTNAEIANLKIRISDDRAAIRKARSKKTGSVVETIFGFLLAPVTGGTSLALAGFGIANIVEGENLVRDMEGSITKHQNKINEYLKDLTADQAQCAALASLSIPTAMALNDLQYIQGPLENIRTDWADFSDKIGDVVTNIIQAKTAEEFTTQKLWYQTACIEWTELVTLTKALIAEATNSYNPPATYKNLYYETDNGAVYVYLDGTLRHIPNPSTFYNLFASPINPSAYVNFASAADAPLPIGNPIMEGACLVQSLSEGIFLQDQMPWNQSETVLRHVVDPSQLVSLGFSTEHMLKSSVNPSHKGVPLALETKGNYIDEEKLAGYYAMYNHLIIKGEMNPFFIYLLTDYPNAHKDNYKAQLKEQIVNAQNVVNNLLKDEGQVLRKLAS